MVARAVAELHSIDCGETLRELHKRDSAVPETFTEAKIESYPLTFLVTINSDLKHL